MRRFVKFMPAMALVMSVFAANTVFAVSEVNVSNELLSPSGITVDSNGEVYIADKGNNNILKIEDNDVEIIAGYTLVNNVYNEPQGGYLDSSDSLKALFDGPTAIALWNDGIIVSDTQNNVLRFIKDGAVTTFAGSEQGFADGYKTKAQFNLPRGLTVDDDGNLYVADSGNGAIRKITTSGTVTTIYQDLLAPCGLDWYEGALYISDMLAHQIFKLEDGELVAITAKAEYYDDQYIGAYVDGSVEEAQFNFPQGLDVSEYGIVVADSGNNAVRLISNDIVTTIASFDEHNRVVITTPVDVVFYGNIVYVVDAFSGILFTEEITDFIFADGKADSWWMESAVELYQMGIINGVGNSEFAPDDTLTRSMIATMLYRYSGEEDELYSGVFSDVVSGEWYEESVNWLAEQGITTGYDDGAFGVEDAVLRQDLAVFLYRYSENAGLDVLNIADISGFADANEVSDYAQEAVCWAVYNGILNGTDDNEIQPLAQATRAEAAKMMFNFIQNQ
ncbi:MAG: S-layer homology domain-containing protein [Clostridia bacterium]